ncbi:hypothetical protein PsalN5692_02496 [Piscirickettsia salmonis]|uniref:hypothetical protein n=1 Tax=Piscirickettsia salmonis TaxID=1238 RepID=UPI0012B6E27F|nr:hypothetical protein [Piscirickettsia salmonis]QGP51023.1 hypothetical protein PsalN5692_02496 [Piscirickettsia salmonis]QGP55730.1 hypothetical protein PsalSR1_03184 [Piscirickettsia salmonis]QGP58404.1 hypothetical protein PsalBI1_00975 [Piscirickettsia salmonis]QGP65299.1 hypothetical protein PsalMR5_03189 [Piscirickettsia salmonis]
MLAQRFKNIVHHSAVAFDVAAKVEYILDFSPYLPIINQLEKTEWVYRVAKESLGNNHAIWSDSVVSMACEDFHLFAKGTWVLFWQMRA